MIGSGSVRLLAPSGAFGSSQSLRDKLSRYPMIAPPALAAHSALDPAGPQAAHIGSLWWLMLWVCLAVFLLVMAFLLAGLVRRKQADTPRAAKVVAAGVSATILILFVFLFASTGTGRTLASLSAPRALAIQVTGHQWWWEIEYLDARVDKRVITANEIHLPIGRPILIRAVSHDVIHSFWVPSLSGKRDLIPGHDSDFWLEADRPGIYRGQCAEFCGQQHAHMALLVVAETPERFARWIEAQRRPAQVPADPVARRGQDVFLERQCALCHAVQGTGAGGRVGPNLTHVASRLTLGAGTLANTPDRLQQWILDPQRAKPGNAMPPTSLGKENLSALLAYLDTLR